ncbi:MAG TPA: FAD-linked oxidase C-terminal domain-containing protein, partial [Gammaproteobacteria bacterium]|nr:FAD-linked oxidase C-terminal domain-containing protein [Gammaproteobacteria bacterium]
VVVPRTADEAVRAAELAAEAGVPLLPRGAGTSQCGQTVGAALVIDSSKHLNRLIEVDAASASAWVEPGIVLDDLNARLRKEGLWYPVDVSTSAQATIGGMTANNSCGARSLRYGNMVHNVLQVETWLSTGETLTFGAVGSGPPSGPARYRELVEKIRALHARERDEIEARVPKLQRRVAGYNLDLASADAFNAAQLLVGSEGTLGLFRKIRLKLAPLPTAKALGVVHFPTFYQAMDLTRHIVGLEPTAVELVDRTMIELAREIAAFRATMDKTIRGEPDAILLVEFAGDEQAPQVAKLKRLSELMADLGLPGSVVEIGDASWQRDVWEVRKAGLNIMMSMKGDGKPVSFIEDCAVPLEHLADYTDRLTRVFEKHGTRGTFYAHASVGCLHVRPVLNLRTEGGARQMRAIAEEACALVKEYKGSYSGEHGDGLVRSEWIEPIYGARLTRAFAELKQAFDPRGLMNPGKIVAATKMDDRSLFRFKPDYRTAPLATGLDWSEHEVGPENRGRGFAAAVEMCNNNGHCRKFDAGTMCPSYRVTRDEQHVTRGRANSLRLALSGQLGDDALASQQLHDTLALCVSCKGCKRECPTGVDMAAMKIEFLHHYHRRHPRSLRDRLVAHLPRYARTAARLAPLMNLRDRIPGVAKLSEALVGLAAKRTLPKWRRDYFRASEVPAPSAANDGRDVVLFGDTFNTYFEPENLRAAAAVLTAGGYSVRVATAPDGRALCCGRTYLATGMLDEARAEARRLLDALAPLAARGVPIVGLEPSCILGLRDELKMLCPGTASRDVARAALTFEEFLVRERAAGRWQRAFKRAPFKRALVHGHCHQKAFGAMPAVVAALQLVPDLTVEVVASSCCGMAGAFGYEAEHLDVSLRMAEAALLPAVRNAGDDTVVVADGTSCRHQIHDGAQRNAEHVARVLASVL